jgi:hypothetical protein
VGYFGNKAARSSFNTTSDTEIFVVQYTCAEAASAVDLTVYLEGPSGAGTKFRLLLYADNGSDYPGTFLAATAELTSPSGWADGWVTGSISYSLQAGTKYWLGIWANGWTGMWYSGTGGHGSYAWVTYSATGSPGNYPASRPAANFLNLIACDYTVTASSNHGLTMMGCGKG